MTDGTGGTGTASAARDCGACGRAFTGKAGRVVDGKPVCPTCGNRLRPKIACGACGRPTAQPRREAGSDALICRGLPQPRYARDVPPMPEAPQGRGQECRERAVVRRLRHGRAFGTRVPGLFDDRVGARHGPMWRLQPRAPDSVPPRRTGGRRAAGLGEVDVLCQSAWKRDPGSASNRDPSLLTGMPT